MEQNLIDLLIQLKLRYFGSRFFSVKNWIIFNEIKLPAGITSNDIESWGEEKQFYLAEQHIKLNGIKSTYEALIIDRLDAAAALQERISVMLGSVVESKDAVNIAKTMKTIAELQDEAMKLLKVDAYKNNLYEENKVSTENLLKENSKTLPKEPEE